MLVLNIIIPLYNSNYIEKQLLSIKKLITKSISIRLILIDDWSDAIYRKIYIKIIEFINIKGNNNIEVVYFYLWDKNWQNRVCKARNKWAELSIWDNLYFIDQETILTNNHLEKIAKYVDSKDVIMWPYLWYNNLVKHIEENDIDFYVENWYINRENFDDFRLMFYQEKQNKKRIWEFFCASNFFIKKQIFLDVWWFDESLTIWWDEDVEFAYRLQKTWYNIIFDDKLNVLNLSDKLYKEPYKILEKDKINSLSKNWVTNYEKHLNPDYKRYIFDRYNHLDENLKSEVSKNFKDKFLNKKNIIIHSINWIGLWHIKRTLSVALELSKQEEIWEIVFVTNSKNPFLIENAWFRIFNLEYWIEDCLNNITFEEYENENYNKINEIIIKNNIDIIIHDTYFIKKIIEKRSNLSHFLILRDSELDYLNTIQNYLYNFKKIFIPHIQQELSQEKINFYEKYKNLIYTWYVLDNSSVYKNGKRNKNIIVSPWYAWDLENSKSFFRYINTLIINNLVFFKGFEITFILWKYYEELFNEIDFYSIIKLIKFDENLSKSITNCELFIWRWWYNTLNEVFFSRTKSLLFPVERNAENQEARIDFFMNKLWGYFIVKWKYDLSGDMDSIEGMIKTISISNPFPLIKEKETTKDWKKIICEELLREVGKENILVFKHIFLPKSENFIYEELRLLKNINPIILTLENENQNIFLHNLNTHYFKEFQELLNEEYPKIYNSELYLKLLKFIIHIIKKNNIKIIYTEFLFDAYFIIKIKTLIPDIKIISAARWYDVYSFLKNDVKNQSLFLNKLDNILVRDKVMKKEIILILNSFPLVKEKEDTSKVEVVRSVLDFGKYEFVKKDFSKLDIIFWWRFVKKKWILEVLDLILLLSKLDFIGKISLFWDWILKDEIIRKIDDLWLKNRIEYLWFLEHWNLLDILKKHNCYINYSKVWENWDTDWIPNLILENILSWNLVFSTLVWWIWDIIIDWKTWIVLSWNQKKDFVFCKDAKQEVFINIVIKAKERVKEFFSYENSINKLERILKKK